MKTIQAFLLAALFAAGSAFADNKSFYWVGPSGDWSDPANWQEGKIPETRDIAYFPHTNAALTVNVDVDDVLLRALRSTGDGANKITFTGNAIRLQAQVMMEFTAPVEFQTPIEVRKDSSSTTHYFYSNAKVYFHAPITIADEIPELRLTKLNGDSGSSGFFPWEFFSTVSGGQVFSIRTGAYVRQGADFDVPYLKFSIAWSEAGSQIYASGMNSVTNVGAGWASTYIYVTNAMPHAVIRPFQAGQYGNVACFEMHQDQTFDRFDGLLDYDFVATDVALRMASFKTDLKLALNGTGNAITQYRLDDSMHFSWNPTGDFTQTFTNRAHTISGSIAVNRGTVRFVGAATLKKLPTITVADGASFVDDSTAASSLTALKTLTLGANARFEIGASAVTTPIAGLTTVSMGAGAKLVLAENCAITAAVLSVSGVCPAAGTYTGADGVAGATKADWIEGAGTIRVVNANVTSWKAAVDGTWSTAEKWSDGLPSSGKTAYVTAEGADYETTLDYSPLVSGRVTVGNDSSHTTTVKVCSDACLPDGAYFNVNRGGRYLQTAGYVAMTNTLIPTVVNDGGLWRITGGTNYYQCSDKGPFTLKKGGRIEITNGRMEMVNRPNTYNPAFSMSGGTVDISGTGVLAFPDVAAVPNHMGSGTTIIRGKGAFTTSSSTGISGSVASPAYLEIRDSGYYYGVETFSVNEAATVLVDSTRRIEFGRSLVLKGKTAPSRVTIAKGSYACSSSYQFNVGCLESSTTTTFPTGIVNVAGGYLHEGGAVSWGLRATSMDGSSIGSAYLNSQKPTAGGVRIRPAYGELNVSGAFTNVSGQCYVGIGSAATGVVNLDGGEFVNRATHANSFATAIGMGGGSGTMAIRAGGKATFARDVYVGGMGTNVINKFYAALTEADEATAVGKVTVSDGSFSARKVVLGAFGAGTLAVAPKGRVTATDLVLSNNVSSTLAFTLADGETVAGRVTLGGKLTITSGAHVEIDGTLYTGGTARFALVTAAGGVEGALDPANVTLVGKGLKLKQTPTGLQAVFSRGLCVFLR